MTAAYASVPCPLGSCQHCLGKVAGELHILQTNTHKYYCLLHFGPFFSALCLHWPKTGNSSSSSRMSSNATQRHQSLALWGNHKLCLLLPAWLGLAWPGLLILQAFARPFDLLQTIGNIIHQRLFDFSFIFLFLVISHKSLCKALCASNLSIMLLLTLWPPPSSLLRKLKATA